MDNPYEPKRKLMVVTDPILKVYEDAAGEWRWEIKSGGNYKITGASSEGFKNKEGALKNLRLVGQQITQFCDKEIK